MNGELLIWIGLGVVLVSAAVGGYLDIIRNVNGRLLYFMLGSVPLYALLLIWAVLMEVK